jgi:SAM-dependent methyltransferase
MRSVEEGHHARKQLGSRSSIIRWSHAVRFQQGVRLAESRSTEKLLDHGCGDGTFLSLMSDKFNACVGADIEPEQVDDCRRRFATVPNVTFCLVQELNGAEHARSYGVVTCMETLEHCTDSTVDSVLADLDRLCTRDGTVVISVPIETGPCLRSQVSSTETCRVARAERVRRLRDLQMARCGPDAVCDRTDSFSSAGLRRSAVALPLTLWFQLPSAPRARRRRFRDQRMLFTPMGLSRGWLSSQVWFVCPPR